MRIWAARSGIRKKAGRKKWRRIGEIYELSLCEESRYGGTTKQLLRRDCFASLAMTVLRHLYYFYLLFPSAYAKEAAFEISATPGGVFGAGLGA